MFNKKNKEANKWYYTALKLSKKNKLDEPYESLFDYFINLSLDTPHYKIAYLDHFTYFFHLKSEGQLEKISTNLNKILPEDLKDNYNRALEKFNAITDYDAEENYDMFETEDDYIDENSEIIKNLLIKHLNLIKN